MYYSFNPICQPRLLFKAIYSRYNADHVRYFKYNIVDLKTSLIICFLAGAREPEERPVTRRSSFRAVKPVMPYEVAADDEKMIKLDSSSAPAVTSPAVSQPVLVPDEERRNRRRGSQL